MRFTKIVEFKEALKDKIIATYKKATEGAGYTTFLKHFGTFTVAELDTKEVSKEDFIVEQLRELKKAMQRQEAIYYERIFSDPNSYRDYPTDKTRIEMMRAVKQVLSRECRDIPPSKRQLPEVREKVFSIVSRNDRLHRYFESPREAEIVFNDVFDELVA